MPVVLKLIDVFKIVPVMHNTFIFLRWLVSAKFSGHHQTRIPEPMRETIQSSV